VKAHTRLGFAGMVALTAILIVLLIPVAVESTGSPTPTPMPPDSPPSAPAWQAGHAAPGESESDGKAIEPPDGAVPQGCSPEALAPGPDGFGYTVDEVAYHWVDISATGTQISISGDDAFGGPYGLGFTFPFYGTEYTQFFASTNGYLSFVGGSAEWINQCPLPNASEPGNLIALLWDDLNFGANSRATYQTFANCPVGSGQCLVVEYFNVDHLGGSEGSAGTWEAILYPSGNVLIQFSDVGVEAGASSTTGIEGTHPQYDHGLTYACDVGGSIINGLAVEFQYPAPSPNLRSSYIEAPSKLEQGVPLAYTIVISNSGSVPARDADLVGDLPPGTTYIPGSLSCSSGHCWYDDVGRAVRWIGGVAALTESPNRSPSELSVTPAGSKQRSQPVELKVDPAARGSVMAGAWQPQDSLVLALDDGSAENFLGVGGATDGTQFIWLNRFSPAPADFPFLLNQISAVFGDEQVNVGDLVDLVVYKDTDGDGDPGNAVLAATYSRTIQAADGATWNDFVLDPPISLAGPGDVLVGIINRYQPGTGAGRKDFPAALDEGASQGRSWAGWWTFEPAPDPAILPPDADWGIIDGFGLPGNWLIRGSGETITNVENPVSITFAVETAGADCGLLEYLAVLNDPALYGEVLLSTSTELVSHLYHSWDFDGGDGGFGANTPPGQWEWGDLVATPDSPPAAHSGTRLWATNLSGNILVEPSDHYLTKALTLPSDPRGIRLQWWDWWDGDGLDAGYVSVNGTVLYGIGSDQHSWQRHTVDLSNWQGEMVDIEFYYQAGGSSPGGAGWYLEDVSIHAACPALYLWPSGVGAGCPAESADHQVTVHNANLTADTIDLTATDGGWPTRIDPPTLFLGAGYTGLVSVTVDVPMGTPYGAADEVTVMATARGSGLATQSSIETMATLGSGWGPLRDALQGTRYHALAYHNGYLYQIGGETDWWIRTGAVNRYELATDTWSSRREMHTAAYGIDAVALGDQIYVPGGSMSEADPIGGGAFLSSLQVYSPGDNTWSLAAPMPAALAYASAVTHGGLLYVIGGELPDGSYSNHLYIYDPAANSWSQGPSMGQGRAYAAAAVVRDKIYVAGGFAGGDILLDSLEIYDPAANSWTYGPNLPFAWAPFGDGVRDNRYLIVLGGGSIDQSAGTTRYWCSTDAWAFDVVTGAWVPLPDLPRCLYGSQADGNGYDLFLVSGRTNEGVWHMAAEVDHLVRCMQDRVSGRICLPLILRNWPPPLNMPVLQPIDNTGGDGAYTVNWSAVSMADAYILQEATRSSFGDATTIYTGPATHKDVTGRGAARYYYRVQAHSASSSSPWSNPRWVDVLWEAEPNDNGQTEANGPIVSGLTYYGLFPIEADVKDYFYFDLPVARPVELWLTNIPPGHDYDLVLRKLDLTEIARSDNSGNADEHILSNFLQTGRYLVQVYRQSKPGSQQEYHLRVVYE